MNPRYALQLADSRHAALRGLASSRLGWHAPLSAAPARAAHAAKRARRATGWRMVEMGLRLAVAREAPAPARSRLEERQAA
ncbi:MAG: hypothetical protein ACRDZT_09560 [Acidimicrobiales bacterium]